MHVLQVHHAPPTPETRVVVPMVLLDIRCSRLQLRNTVTFPACHQIQCYKHSVDPSNWLLVCLAFQLSSSLSHPYIAAVQEVLLLSILKILALCDRSPFWLFETVAAIKAHAGRHIAFVRAPPKVGDLSNSYPPSEVSTSSGLLRETGRSQKNCCIFCVDVCESPCSGGE